ncbi:unnamed protein product [Tilletia controversa]|uniref:RRM domain-containing protein n=3 Tax=Tilletia TaxID=13289 RepID=A0A8X7MPG0_9BASI|nr:hypothetical protein CF335_g7219 [Tilletia laevis]KAE8191459.1 hypothetical protein CF328_g5673 [Tilletia controversa]KAE8255845.1 hypothetical protein A4X03_0g5503 [Tilletia caries]KAE8189277.1 hypothetical protein CF336_g5800 [Tilletia laevis]KAE8243108.1 hypothetical protein A4X06_0g6549 [Tilletia controversa]
MPPPKVQADAAPKGKKAKPSADIPDSAEAPKLTKAQQKTLKFKDKSKRKGGKHGPEGNELPERDDGDEDGGDGVELGADRSAAKDEKLAVLGKPNRRTDKGKGKSVGSEGELDRKASQKRKREGDAESKEAGASNAWPDQADSAAAATATAGEGAEAPKKKKRRKSKKGGSGEGDGSGAPRLIVFVGNMSFTVTSNQLAKHFGETCGETPSVRLLTRKMEDSKLSASKLKSIAKGKASGPKQAADGSASANDKDPVLMGQDGKPLSKGCAFVEFKTATALQKALRFHHTQFGGRQINVELTAGGGGKGTDRMEKIKAKNTELESERAKLHDKYVAPAAAVKKTAAAEKKAQEGVPQWGSRGGKSAAPSSGTPRPAGKGKWTPSGANATRLTDY